MREKPILILTPGSLIQEKLKTGLQIFKKIAIPIGSFFKKYFFQVLAFLKKKGQILYDFLMKRKASIQKKVVWIGMMLVFLEIISIGIGLIQPLGMKVALYNGLVLLILLILDAVFLIMLRRIQKNWGDCWELEQRRQETFLFVKNHAPTIVKIDGFTGAGKDETAAGFATLKIEGFRQDIIERMEEIRRLAYCFDFEIFTEKLLSSFSFFSKINDDETFSNEFFNFCIKNRFFILKKRQKSISFSQFVKEYQLAKKIRVIACGDFILDFGGINKKHYLELLEEYAKLLIRFKEGHFLFTNQPFMEDLESGQGAAIFSLNYLITKKQEDWKVDGRIYEEKILFPFKDYMGIVETEVGTWYVNLDRKIQQLIQALGIRDFKAFNRHYFPNFFWYQVDQDPDRVSKLFRELDHAYCFPKTRTVIKAPCYELFCLEKKLGRICRKKERILQKKDRFLKRQEARLEHEKKLGRYFEVSSQLRYREKMLTIREKRLRPFPKEQKLLLLEEKAAGLESEKKRCEYEHTYIEKILIISPKPMTGDSLVVHTAGDILNNPDILRSSYAVKTTFRASDCWRYDTHYLSSSKNERAKRSELSLSEVDCWDASLKMRPEHVAKMGYVQGAQLFGLSADDMKKMRFKEKNQKKV